MDSYNKMQFNSQEDRVKWLESELNRTYTQLTETQTKLSAILDNMPGGVLGYDADTGKFDFISEGVLSMFHCSEEQFREKYYNSFELMVQKSDRARVKQQISDQLAYFDTVEITYRVEGMLDNTMWIYHRGRLCVEASGRKLFFVVISDITEEKLVQSHMNQAAQKLREKAERDPMTGLLNKVSMQAAISDCIERSNMGDCHAMLMIDTDNFKSVNDTFGHQYGDKIIIFVADAISKIFRGSDYIGRMGGDEFMVFMKFTTPAITEERAHRLNDAIRATLREGDATVKISCSIGISYFDRDGGDYESLYSAADAALYETKESGKDGYRVFKSQ